MAYIRVMPGRSRDTSSNAIPASRDVHGIQDNVGASFRSFTIEGAEDFERGQDERMFAVGVL